MATLAVNDASAEGGAAITAVAADVAGDEFSWGENTHFEVENGGGSPVTVTLTAQATTSNVKNFGNMSRADVAESVAAGEVRRIPAPPRAFRDATGNVQVTYSAVTSVTVAAVNMG